MIKTDGNLHVRLLDEDVVLTPERALYHPETRTVFVADMHIGKSATFRAAAIPVPEGDTMQDLERLDRVISRTKASRLVVLGDFLHAAPGRLDLSWVLWRQRHPSLDVSVVRGNHDTHAGDPPASWGLKMVDEPYRDGPFLARHHPATGDGIPNLAGHVHPTVRLRGMGRDRISLPCFHFAGGTCVLPAFTVFSGGYPVRPGRGDRIFAPVDGAVVDVTRLAGRR